MSGSDNDSDWSDVAVEEDGVKNVRCLFCHHCDVNIEPSLLHMINEHNVDIKTTVVKLNLDFYGYFKFINYTRKTNATPLDVNAFTIEIFSDDKWLKPALEDDVLLQYDIENLHINQSDNCSEIQSLNVQLSIAEERAKLAEEFLERTIDDLNMCRKELNNLLLGGDKTKVNAKMNGHVHDEKEDVEDYFSTYAHYGIHEEMLKDKTRTGAYQSFILGNRHLFEGLTVLDVGCGTSVLSMFAAQAGSAHVIGVDNSEVAYQAMDIVRENNLVDVIKIEKCQAEELGIQKKVDVIVSEWMGYFLLFESMLDTVIYCRDHYLSESGCVYPDKCNITLVALDDDNLYESKVKYWDGVYGFKMSAMKTSVLQEPLVAVVPADKVISQEFILKEFDLMKINVSNVEFEANFDLRINKDGILSALVGYFDIGFERKAKNPVKFSTSPFEVATHWKQTIFFLKEPIAVKNNDLVRGQLTCKKHKKYNRSLDISIVIYDGDKVACCQQYYMS